MENGEGTKRERELAFYEDWMKRVDDVVADLVVALTEADVFSMDADAEFEPLIECICKLRENVVRATYSHADADEAVLYVVVGGEDVYANKLKIAVERVRGYCKKYLG